MKFGTSGLRGLATDLTGPASALYAEAFVVHLRRLAMIDAGSKVFIGRDFRSSSPDIRDRCASGIMERGLMPVDCGALPTPALAHHAMEQGAPSLMITGSHIPEDRNGIKFYRPDGEIGKDDEAAIKAIAEEMEANYSTPAREASALASDTGKAMTDFVQRCQGILPKNNLAGLHVGVFEHSSVAREMLHDVLQHFGAETKALGREDNFVAVDTEAVSAETTMRLAAWAAEHGFDAIVSTDGDADRPLVADESGCPVRGDLLGLVTAEFLGASIVATPVTSNSGIVSSPGMKVVRTRVGSPYVIEAMQTSGGKGTVVGFEANGGFLQQTSANVPGGLLTALPTRDCILPIIAVLHAVKQRSIRMSQLSSVWKFPVAVADRLQDYPTDEGRALVEGLSENADTASGFFAPMGLVTSLDTTDGSRFTLNDGEIVHYRPSGNAPELRCYCEAATEKRARELLGFGLSQASARLS